jgi:hypothetical protein
LEQQQSSTRCMAFQFRTRLGGSLSRWLHCEWWRCTCSCRSGDFYCCMKSSGCMALLSSCGGVGARGCRHTTLNQNPGRNSRPQARHT